VRELIVVAQDTTAYGTDIYGESKLCELLSQLCKIEKIKWIRTLYTYPERITDELLDLMAREEKLVKYLDMPIQHANGEILKRMNRKGDKDALVALIERIRNKTIRRVVSIAM
jgi:ribosomal protein S12 methylthiotransferase